MDDSTNGKTALFTGEVLTTIYHVTPWFLDFEMNMFMMGIRASITQRPDHIVRSFVAAKVPSSYVLTVEKVST